MKKRIISFLVAVSILAGMMSPAVYAEDILPQDTPQATPETASEEIPAQTEELDTISVDENKEVLSQDDAAEPAAQIEEEETTETLQADILQNSINLNGMETLEMPKEVQFYWVVDPTWTVTADRSDGIILSSVKLLSNSNGSTYYGVIGTISGDGVYTLTSHCNGQDMSSVVLTAVEKRTTMPEGVNPRDYIWGNPDTYDLEVPIGTQFYCVVGHKEISGDLNDGIDLQTDKYLWSSDNGNYYGVVGTIKKCGTYSFEAYYMQDGNKVDVENFTLRAEKEETNDPGGISLNVGTTFDQEYTLNAGDTFFWTTPLHAEVAATDPNMVKISDVQYLYTYNGRVYYGISGVALKSGSVTLEQYEISDGEKKLTGSRIVNIKSTWQADILRNSINLTGRETLEMPKGVQFYWIVDQKYTVTADHNEGITLSSVKRLSDDTGKTFYGVIGTLNSDGVYTLTSHCNGQNMSSVVLTAVDMRTTMPEGVNLRDYIRGDPDTYNLEVPIGTQFYCVDGHKEISGDFNDGIDLQTDKYLCTGDNGSYYGVVGTIKERGTYSFETYYIQDGNKVDVEKFALRAEKEEETDPKGIFLNAGTAFNQEYTLHTGDMFSWWTPLYAEVVATDSNMVTISDVQYLYTYKGRLYYGIRGVALKSGSVTLEAYEPSDNGKKLISSRILNIKPTDTAYITIDKQPQDVVGKPNTPLQFSIKASGDGLTYQWQLAYAGSDNWQNVPVSFAGGKTDTLTVTATEDRNGYKFRCIVKDDKNNSVTSSAATLTVEAANQPLKIISLTADKTTADSGDHITITANVTGGAGGYTYKFIINDTTNDSWYKLQDYKETNSIVWKATSAGTKRIMVDVKDKAGNKVATNISIKVNGTVSVPLSAELKSSAVTVKQGETVTLTAVAKGGSGKYNYKFIINDKTDDKWYRLQDFGANNIITWKATTPGTKRLMVDVMDSTGKKVGHNITITVTK